MAFSISTIGRVVALLAAREESAQQRAEAQQAKQRKRRSCLGKFVLCNLVILLASGRGGILVGGGSGGVRSLIRSSGGSGVLIAVHGVGRGRSAGCLIGCRSARRGGSSRARSGGSLVRVNGRGASAGAGGRALVRVHVS